MATRKVRMARVRDLEDQAVALLAAAHRQWWRPVRNCRRHLEAAALLREAGAELDAIAEARAKYGRHDPLGDLGPAVTVTLPPPPPGAIGWSAH